MRAALTLWAHEPTSQMRLCVQPSSTRLTYRATGPEAQPARTHLAGGRGRVMTTPRRRADPSPPPARRLLHRLGSAASGLQVSLSRSCHRGISSSALRATRLGWNPSRLTVLRSVASRRWRTARRRKAAAATWAHATAVPLLIEDQVMF